MPRRATGALYAEITVEQRWLLRRYCVRLFMWQASRNKGTLIGVRRTLTRRGAERVACTMADNMQRGQTTQVQLGSHQITVIEMVKDSIRWQR